MNRQQGKRFVSIPSNQQHFQPTLHSPPEVKIREITIHEPSSFLKRGHKLQSICMIVSIQSNQVKLTKFLIHPTLSRGAISLPQIDFRHVKSTTGETSHIDSIESTTFSTHPQSPDQLYFLSLQQIDFRHVESTEGETTQVELISG